MAYILDGAVILIVLAGLFLGYRRGFVRTLIKAIGCVVALVLAGYLSQIVAQGVFDHFIQEKMETSIAGQVSVAEGDSLKDTIHSVVDSLPNSVQNVLNNSGWIDRAAEQVDAAVAVQPEAVAQPIVTYIVRPVVTALLGIVAFLVLFILLMIVISLLARLVGNVLRLPGLRQIDGILGAVLGTVEGILLAMVAVAILQIASASASNDSWLSPKDIDQTVLVSQMAKHNPITNYWNIV